MHAASDLSVAAYCPRQLYYRRDDDREVPPSVAARRELAFEYERLLAVDDASLSGRPIDRPPERYRTNLRRTRERLECWDVLVDTPHRDRLLSGRECRGIAGKVLDDPLAPSYISPGAPPEQGVWKPHAVRAVALAKALSWEHEEAVETAFVEYPHTRDREGDLPHDSPEGRLPRRHPCRRDDGRPAAATDVRRQV